MRRWIADRCRLALRKVLPRLIVFAAHPTRAELRQITEALFSAWFETQRGWLEGQMVYGGITPESRNKLH